MLDRQGEAIERWTRLGELSTAIRPKPNRSREITVAVDVANRLLGAKGATRVYGPQKGMRPADFSKAENWLRRLARVAALPFAKFPGAGAAGGLGFGLTVFMGAKVVPGFELFAAQCALAAKLMRVDLVITGEGFVDRSTHLGKGVGQLVAFCQRAGVPCLVLAGVATREARRWRALTGLWTMADHSGRVRSVRRPASCLEELSSHVAGLLAKTSI